MTKLEQELSTGNLPWTEIEFRTKTYWVFKHHLSSNHLVFVPVGRTFDEMQDCYKAAYNLGYSGISNDKWDTFTINQVVGQSNMIDYPFIELIPL